MPRFEKPFELRTKNGKVIPIKFETRKKARIHLRQIKNINRFGLKYKVKKRLDYGYPNMLKYSR